ncbi:MAG: D-erythronate dehydrogenase [Pseudomonadota bacterium]
MKVLITGGTGFIGQRLARAILERGKLTGPDGEQHTVDEIVLFDQSRPKKKPSWFTRKIKVKTGDISKAETVRALFDRDDMSVFHLASVVSGGGEQDFNLAMKVNLNGGLHIFESTRALKGLPRLVFSSTLAVYGGDGMPDSVGDFTKQNPQTTYGITKAACELLVNDYTRKGYFDGRSARLPTVIIRPGKPNAAASSFVSGVFREPLNGEVMSLPVELDTVMPVIGYKAVVDGLIALHEMNGSRLGKDRAVLLPSHTVTVKEMIEALKRVARGRPLGEIKVEPDPFIQEIVRGWPLDTYHDRASMLRLPLEKNLDEIVQYFIEDYVDGDWDA